MTHESRRRLRRDSLGVVLGGVVLGGLALGAGPVACLSDATLPAAGGSGGGARAGVGGAGGDSALGDAGMGATAGTHSGSDGGAATGGASGSGVGGSAGAAAVVGEAGLGGEGGNTAGFVSGTIAPLVLPAPCNEAPYATTLHIDGGTPPYDWQITPRVDHWGIARDSATPDGAAAQLTGVPNGPLGLTIQVTDAHGIRTQQIYSVVPRTSCWFAYTALETAGPELHLVDPILEQAPPVALENNQGVFDFHFSPNGKFLAYRFGADADHPTGKHLALLDLSTWNEQVLSLAEDAVTAYAWSGDSSVLAAAFEIGQLAYLGGVRVAGTIPVQVTRTPVLIDSDVYWVGSNFVAFYAAVAPDGNHPGEFRPSANERTAFYSQLGGAAFQTAVAPSEATFYPGVLLQPSDDGFFMVTGTDPGTYFDSTTPGVTPASHFSTSLIAPSGHFSAELAGDQLLIFGAADGDLNDPIASSGTGPGCPKILAWAKGHERIACVADTSSGSSAPANGEVHLFNLGSSSLLSMSPVALACDKSVASSCSALEYDYTEESAAGQARAFSPSGKWLAFTTGSPGAESDSYLYWADTESQPPTVKRKVHLDTFGATAVLPTELAFSADNHYLLVQRAGLLTAFDATAAENSGPSSDLVIVDQSLPTGTPATVICSEDFPSAPGRYCGNADRAAPFAWSPDSRFAAYQAVNQVIVADFTAFPGFASHRFSAPDCSQKCAGQFAFQPD